jgi:hypothetical protein
MLRNEACFSWQEMLQLSERSEIIAGTLQNDDNIIVGFNECGNLKAIYYMSYAITK